MDYDTFLGQVMQGANLETTGDGQRVIRAVIETLGERLGDHEQKDLQAQLPQQMKGWIHQRANGEPFPVNEFYRRVAVRADLTESQAEADTRHVLGHLRDAISGGEMRDIFETLPEDYRKAFREPQAASGER